MATGMKLWLTATVAGIAIVAAWKLPPSPYTPREAPVRAAETMRAEAVNEEFRVTAEALRRVQWADSLAPLAISTATDGSTFLFPSEVELNADQVRRFEEMIAREVAQVRDSDMVFGYVMQPHGQNQQPDMGVAARRRTELLVGSFQGQEYCLQVRVHDTRQTAWTLAQKLAGEDRVRPLSGAVGACRPYLHHGLPGARIQRWLEEGGIALASEQGESGVTPPALAGRRTVLGFSGYGNASSKIEGDQCLAGYAASCTELLMEPARANELLERDLKVVRMSPVTSIGTWGIGSSVLHDEQYLFYDLEQEFGSEAFGRFWTSDEDVETAFEGAFGLEFGAWIVSWVDRTVGVDEPGPRVSRSSSSGTTILIALLAGMAFMRTRKRQVV